MIGNDSKGEEIIKRKTIKDVALHSGFGIGTVSRAINQEEGVHEETKRKILEVAEKLNYKPHRIAQSMRSQKYKNIAFFSDISNPIFAQIVKETQIELDKFNFTLSLCNTGGGEARKKIISFLEKKIFDGIVLSTPTENDEELNELLNEIDIPIVTINREIPGIPPGVIIDYYYSVKEAIEYLLSLGHENIALVGGDKEIMPTKRSIRAYKETYAKFNKTPNMNLIFNGELTDSYGEEIFHYLLPDVLNKNITAILSLNNQIFNGILRVMRKKDIRYPQDISLITFEDNELMQLLNPSITVIHRPVINLGKSVANRIITYIQNPNLYGKMEPISLSAEFIKRNSCKDINNITNEVKRTK